jgi:uncharacterized protein (TIGR00725 family)
MHRILNKEKSIGMKITVGVMGSANDALAGEANATLSEKTEALASAIAAGNVMLLTGGTTGIVYGVGKRAHEAGVLHVGISPASNEHEHRERYKLPTDACDLLIYTGFGLKGRNVVLVRSCDVVLFIAGAMGTLNEFTIAHDEGKIIGCLMNTGGVADEADYLLQKFSKKTGARILRDENPERLLAACLGALTL